MRAVISTYFKTEKKALAHALQKQKLWRGKTAFYVLCAKNGYFVISESVARILYPEKTFSKKDRRYYANR